MVELRVRGLSVHYDDHTALDDLTLTVAAGSWLTVIGPNGAGKSSLLKALAGIVDHRGSIELVVERSRRSAETVVAVSAGRVAYLPQSPVLPPGMTTAEYVLVGRTSHLRWYRFESGHDRELVARTLEDLDLAPLAARPVAHLSGGEAQRVALARAMVQEASVLVLDEPTSALDLAHQLSVLDLVDRLRRSHGLIVVSSMHDLTIASRYADQILLLDQGHCAESGSPAEVLTADILSEHYGVEIEVLPGPRGGLVIVPCPSPSPFDEES